MAIHEDETLGETTQVRGVAARYAEANRGTPGTPEAAMEKEILPLPPVDTAPFEAQLVLEAIEEALEAPLEHRREVFHPLDLHESILELPAEDLEIRPETERQRTCGSSPGTRHRHATHLMRSCPVSPCGGPKGS
jgi:hypothetical protein